MLSTLAKHPTLFLLAALVFAISTRANADNDLMLAMDENYFFSKDMPVVLSASRLAQPVADSPAAMTIIDRELIEASGALNIPDLLRLVPGFQVSHLSGQNLTAQYHGLADQNPKRMQVMIDGRSVYHAAFGGVRWDTLPISLNDIERIEVLRGSNAASYGSNAFMGVVNIITRHPSQDRGDQITLTGGYGDTYQVEWRHGGSWGDLDYRFGLSTFSTSGFPNYTNTHDYWDSTGVVPPAAVPDVSPYVGEILEREIERDDDQRISRFNFRGDYVFDNGDGLLFEAGYARNDRDDSLLEGDYDKLRPDENLRSSFQLLKWSRPTRGQGEIAVQASHNLLDFDNQHIDYFILDIGPDLYNLGPVLGGSKYRVRSYDLELQHRLPKTPDWRIVWGLGARLDQVGGENIFIDDEDYERLQLRAFGHAEKRFGDQDQWVINAGLMLEHQEDFGVFASPRLAINHHLDDYHTVRVAAARAYRMPSLAEQFNESALFALSPPFGAPPYNYVLNTNRGFDIDPESVTTFELGFMSTDWIDGLSMDVRLFHEELRHYIDDINHLNGCNGCDTSGVLGFDPHDIRVTENAGKLDIQGLDLQARFSPNDRTTFLQTASFTRARGYAFRTRDDAGNLITGDTDNTADYVPKLTVSALLSHRFNDGWNGSIAYYAMSDMDWPNDGDALNDYSRVDLRLAKKLHLGGNDSLLELIVQNAFDEEFEEFRHQNRFERRAYLRLRMDLD